MFRLAAKSEVIFIPNKGINTNPAKIGPRNDPNELTEYNFPMSFPLVFGLTYVWLTTGHVAPNNVAGIIRIKNIRKNCRNCVPGKLNINKYITSSFPNIETTNRPYKPIPISIIPNNLPGFFVLCAMFLNK